MPRYIRCEKSDCDFFSQNIIFQAQKNIREAKYIRLFIYHCKGYYIRNILIYHSKLNVFLFRRYICFSKTGCKHFYNLDLTIYILILSLLITKRAHKILSFVTFCQKESNPDVNNIF